MATKQRYTATFSDGTSIARNSERAYSHCWILRYTFPNGGAFAGFRGTESGFSGTEALARKALDGNYNRAYATFAEIVPATVTP